jgi:hypothetical protein
MATIRVKRGTTKPTTASLAYVGELAFDYTNNALYARNSTEVVKVGGELEKVYSYEGASYNHSASYPFDPAYIYKIHIIASTMGTTVDTSATFLYYRTAGLSNLLGSHNSIWSNDVSATITKVSARNTITFTIPDVHSSGATLTSGITKVIDMELTPTFANALTDNQQWVVYGKAATTVAGQADATITMVDFVHSFLGAVGNLYINPGLNLGNPDLISVTIYRTLRK